MTKTGGRRMVFPNDYNQFIDLLWTGFNVILLVAIIINVVLFVKKINRVNRYLDQKEKPDN